MFLCHVVYFILCCLPAVHIHFISSIVMCLSQFVGFVSLLAAILSVILLLCHAVVCILFQWFSFCLSWCTHGTHALMDALGFQEISVGELCSLIGCWISIVMGYIRAAWLHHVFIPSLAAVETGCALKLS